MKLNFKATLLSGLLLPGLGQLRSGRRVKGGILLFLVNVLFLGILFTAMRAAGKVLANTGTSGGLDPSAVIEQIWAENPLGKWLIAGFAALWGYGFLDALFDRSKG